MSESEPQAEVKQEEVAATPEVVAAPPATEIKIEAKKWAGKYDSPEALETAYGEAQKLISSRQTIDSIEDFGAKAGVKISEAVATYMTDGKMNLEQVKAFEMAGIGKDLALRMVEGEASRIKVLQYEVEKVQSEVNAVTGGRAQLDNVLNWAAATMTKADIDKFNTKLNDPKTAVSAAREITFMHQQAVGSGNARPLVQGQTPVAESPGFSSVSEVVKAMAMLRKQGYVDETTRRRLSNTPTHFMQGLNK